MAEITKTNWPVAVHTIGYQAVSHNYELETRYGKGQGNVHSRKVHDGPGVDV